MFYARQVKSRNVMKNETKCASTGWGNALVIFEDTPSTLVGKLLTLAETWGMSEKQEKAVKEMIRQEVYRAFDTAWIIGDQTHYEIRKMAHEFGQRSVGGLMPENADDKIYQGSMHNPETT